MRSLAFRLTTAIVGLLVVSNAGITILAINRKRHAFEEDLQVQAEILIEALVFDASEGLQGDDMTHLDDMIRSVARESSPVLGGRIFNADGLAVYDSYDAIKRDMGPDPFALELLASNEMLFEWGRDRVMAGRRMMGVNDPFVITLELSTEDMKARRSKALWQGFQAASVSIAAGTLLALVIARSISLPLQAMVQATSKIAAGDLQQRLQEQGITELAALSRGFNQMTKQLHVNLLRKGAILHYALDPIITLDENGKIEEFNDASERVFGHQRSFVFGRDFTELIVAESWRQSFKTALDGWSVGESSELFERWAEIRAMRSDGQEFPADFSVSCGAVEGVKLFTVMVRDVTERKRMEEQLRLEARHDPLTGLSNRSDFNRCLDQAFQHFKQDADAAFAVLFLDFDRFKFINDSLGHKIGDLLLTNIARRLQACVRPGDLIARLGGDEFTVLLENVNDAEFAEHTAKRILQRLSSPFQLEGHQVSITASIGIVLSSTHHDAADEILRDADATMYSAKAAGKNQYLLFDKAIGEKAKYRWQIEQDLRQALPRQEFQLNYQPIIESQTKTLIGFEVLLRWAHSQLGWIPPNEFIPIAEESGTIGPIGMWVLQTSCQQMVEWQQYYQPSEPLALSVNLSFKQMLQSDLVKQIERVLLKTGFAAEQLKLEITETIFMENFEMALAHCSALRRLGVQIYIDDFGTGYSSLSYLNKLPIDALKIDRSFISDPQVDVNSWRIVQTILALAREMGLDAIAEGVENAEQMEQLTQLGCNYLQGYFVAKPLSVGDAEALVEAGSLAPHSDAILPVSPMSHISLDDSSPQTSLQHRS